MSGSTTTGGAVVSVEVTGANQLAALAKALRQAGDKELQRELFRGLNRAVKPVREVAKASALAVLPSRGGFAARVARGKFVTQRRSGARVAGIRVVAKNTDRRVDQGRLRHPVFGNRGVWVTQQVTPGWWSRPTEALRPQVRDDLIKAMDDVAREISRRVAQASR